MGHYINNPAVDIQTSRTRAEAIERITLVRGGDYDRFLAIQLAPKAKRAALYAVTALHVEVARIAETVSEPLIGHIRLAWWREALEEIMAGKPPRNHPVTLALAQVYREHPAVFPLLGAMIEARAADLDDSLIEEEEPWRAYVDATAGGLHVVWALILNATAAVEHESAIRAQARGYAMIGLVRAIPFMARQGALRFPKAQLHAHELESLAPSAGLKRFAAQRVAEALGERGAQHNLIGLRPLLGLDRLCELYAKKLKQADYNPYALRPDKLGPAWQIAKINIF